MLRTFIAIAIVGLSLVGAQAALGRGFGGGGGFHGGGGGGFHGGGGGFSGGGYHGGGMGGYGGARAGGMGDVRGGDMGAYRGGAAGGLAGGAGAYRGGDLGGYRGGAAGDYRGGEAGAFRGGEAGALGGYRGGEAPTRSGLNQFLGMPSDGGLHSMSSSRAGDNFNVDHGSAEGPRGGEAAGTAVTGPRGNTVARGAAVGPDGGVVAGRGAVGADGAGVAQGVAAGPGGRVAAGEVARGPEGGVAGRGVVAGPRGAVGGYGYMSPSARYGAAYGIRAGYRGYGLYTPGWYTAHPGAWAAAGIATAAWTAATWDNMNAWFDTTAEPVDYDYGSNVVTQDGNVYVDGQDAGTEQAYYDQAEDLANAGAQATPSDDQNWMPLGVFAMSEVGKSSDFMSIQLAVNKQGILRGNFTDTKTNKTQAVQGSVDKTTQRAAWTIGDNKADVMETGLYNLTKDEVPALLHFGNDRTQQWLLVRVKQEDQQQNQDAQAPTPAPGN